MPLLALLLLLLASPRCVEGCLTEGPWASFNRCAVQLLVKTRSESAASWNKVRKVLLVETWSESVASYCTSCVSKAVATAGAVFVSFVHKRKKGKGVCEEGRLRLSGSYHPPKKLILSLSIIPPFCFSLLKPYLDVCAHVSLPFSPSANCSSIETLQGVTRRKRARSAVSAAAAAVAAATADAVAKAASSASLKPAPGESSTRQGKEKKKKRRDKMMRDKMKRK